MTCCSGLESKPCASGSCACTSPSTTSKTAGEGCLLGADPGWLKAHRELRNLHVEKSSTYGTDADRFQNFTAVGEITGEPPEYYALCRIREKVERAIIQIRAGDADGVAEYPDVASLALICEALLRRRTN